MELLTEVGSYWDRKEPGIPYLNRELQRSSDSIILMSYDFQIKLRIDHKFLSIQYPLFIAIFKFHLKVLFPINLIQ